MTILTERIDPPEATVAPTGLSPEGRAWRGFAIGVGLAIALTAWSLAWDGWRALLVFPVFNLIWLPCLLGTLGFLGIRRRLAGPIAWSRIGIVVFAFAVGFVLAAFLLARLNGGLVSLWGASLPLIAIVLVRWLELPPRREWPQRQPRLHLRTLMFLVAYVAILFGLGIATERVGRPATIYYQRSLSYGSMRDAFRLQMGKSEQDARLRLDNARQLHEGRIPVGLLPEQITFLRSLDATATPEYRKQRYALIEAGEERQGRLQERSMVVFRGLIDHFEALTAKYRQAARRPWLPVEPDPPLPPTQ